MTQSTDIQRRAQVAARTGIQARDDNGKVDAIGNAGLEEKLGQLDAVYEGGRGGVVRGYSEMTYARHKRRWACVSDGPTVRGRTFGVGRGPKGGVDVVGKDGAQERLLIDVRVDKLGEWVFVGGVSVERESWIDEDFERVLEKFSQ